MIKTKKRLAFMIFIMLCALLCVPFAMKTQKANEAEAEAVTAELQTQDAIANSYAYGSTLQLPDGVLLFDGKEYVADGYYLKKPNGKIYEGKTHELDAVGQYTVIYTATADSTYLTAGKTFSVVRNTYEVTSNKSQAMYVDNLESVENGGLQVGLAEGDTFTFNEPVCLSDDAFFKFAPYKTYYETIKTPKKPSGGYTYALTAMKTTVRLTDCYEPNNYVDIVFEVIPSNNNEIPYSYCTYLKASANGSENAAMTVVNANTKYYGTRREVYMDGTAYCVYYGSDYGVAGAWGNGKVAPSCALRYDTKTNAVYCSYNGKAELLISDLDNGDVYDGVTFNGFSSDEVYLSVYASTYYESTVEMEMSKIGTYEGEALNLGEYKDVISPEIRIQSTFDTDKKYYVAKGEEIEVFSATATDINLVGGVTTRVFYAYDSENATQVYLKDNKFKPTKEGEYTIVYSACDSYGNVAEKTVSFLVVEAEKSVSLQTEHLQGVEAGKEYVLPEYTLSSINDEDITMNVYALFMQAGSEKVPIDPNTRVFFPTQVGRYKIVYEYFGAVRNYEYSYEVESVSAGNVRIDESTVILPKTLLKSASYTFDEVKAERYDSATPTLVDCKYYVSEDGGAFKAIDYSDYTVTANEKVQFKYACENVERFSAEIPVVDVGFDGALKMEEYFVGNVNKTVASAGVTLEAKETSGSAIASFVNVLSLRNFQMKFRISAERTNYDSLELILTDYYNRSISTRLIFAKQTNGGMNFSIDGGVPSTLKHDFSATQYTTVSYNVETNKFEILNDVNGACLAEYTSDKVLLEIRLNGVNGAGAVDIQSLNLQRFSKAQSDIVSPVVSYDDSEQGERRLDEIVTVSEAIPSDLLSPYLNKNLTVKVIMPNGEYAVALDGTLLNGSSTAEKPYQIKLSDYGMYQVQYSYADQAGNSTSSGNGYAIYVSDRTKPTITLADGYGEGIVVLKKYNDKVSVASYSVSDDFGESGLTSYVCVFSPTNKAKYVSSGGAVKLDERGVWRVCYYCQDAEGNMAMRYYQIRVE